MENRFEGAIWHGKIKTKTALIVGLGATGSYTSLFLGRSGVNNFELVDMDTYEYHNIGSQMASYMDITKFKVDVNRDLLVKYTSAKGIFTHNSRIEDISSYYGLFNRDIIICTLDSMSGRKYMFEQWLSINKSNTIFLDTRIGAEYWELYAIPQGDQEKIDKYKLTLFDDDRGNVGACNYQQSTLSAAGAALQLAEVVNMWITNELTEDTYLPYKITKDLRTQNHGISY